MTDNEIIKALESEVKSAEYVDSYYCNGVDLTLIKSTIDLIKRQQAEIERLTKETMNMAITIETCQTEAVTEFAERLKEGAQMADCFDSYNMVVGTHFINNLLKEMLGEE